MTSETSGVQDRHVNIHKRRNFAQIRAGSKEITYKRSDGKLRLEFVDAGIFMIIIREITKIRPKNITWEQILRTNFRKKFSSNLKIIVSAKKEGGVAEHTEY